MIETIISSENLIVPNESYVMNNILHFYKHFFGLFNSNEEKNDLKEVLRCLLHHIQYKSINNTDIQPLVSYSILNNDELLKVYQYNGCDIDNEYPFVKHNRYYYRIYIFILFIFLFRIHK